MIISVVNRTNGKVTDEDLQSVIRAINRQIAQDFQPYWSFGAVLRLDGSPRGNPDQEGVPDMRGDAILYLWDKVGQTDELGYHNRNNRGIPYGFVFTDLATELGEDWSITLSHEALELVADPEANLLVAGPNPGQPDRTVFFWYEMCDAVQSESYSVDGIAVSNFLLPLYFTGSGDTNGRTDFLGRPDSTGQTLSAYGVKPGGYIGYFDPILDKDVIYSRPNDPTAMSRLQVKSKAGPTRRANRYRRFNLGLGPNMEDLAAQFRGTLHYDVGESRLDGTLLAVKGMPDPLGAATNFLKNKGFKEGQSIIVTGEKGFIGNVPVIFMTDVRPAP